MPNARLPDNIHRLRGTYRKDRHGDPEALSKLPPGAPDCPAWLSRSAKTEWRRIVKVLEPLGVLTAADLAILAVYCELYSEFKADPAGFTAARLTQMRLCMAELGLTPASRGRVKAAAMAEKNPFEDL